MKYKTKKKQGILSECGTYYKIPLTQGKFALVDVEDYNKVKNYNWAYAGRYAQRICNDTHKSIKMHKEIMPVPEGMVIDHINNQGTDNRKGNLRQCTQQQNTCNKTKTCLKNGKAPSSKWKGVSWHKPTGKWLAQIGFNNKKIALGYFDDELAAAVAYNVAAKELHGKFAKLNVFDK